MTATKHEYSTELREVASVFLKLGVVAFGGPAAHIAMMEEEVVRRRQWMPHERFLDLLGATNLIPGPNSTEMAIHIGYQRAGWRGLIAAGASFIIPAVLISLVLAHLYTAYGSVPQLEPFILGVRSGIIAVIAAAVFRLGRPMLKRRHLIFTCIAVAILSLLHVDEILLLFAAGVSGLAWSYRQTWPRGVSSLFAVGPLLRAPLLTMSAGAAGSATLMGLTLFFLKIGSILFGSGYVLVAFLQGGLVDVRHWLTQAQLLDAVAVGQFTPGPVLSTATFIGYLILGIPGAFVATIGIFLPSFIFVLISSPFLPRLRKSPLASGFLDGVNAASLGLMIAVCIVLAASALTGVGSWIIFLLAAVAVAIWNVNAAWIVAASALLGWLFSLRVF